MREGSAIRVWDGPTRIFHWAVVALVFTSWLTQQEDWMAAHKISGYTMFAALLFRFVWGFIGSDTARFSHFLASPRAAFAHLRHFIRREPDHRIGHNAAGGWMVLVMLLALAVQVGTGLCANDQVRVEGPLAEWVGPEWSDWLSHVHAVTFTVIEVAIVLHVAAVLAYALVKRHNLVAPMITGRKRLPSNAPAPRMRSPILAAIVFALAGAIVAWVVLLS
ncbi:MAG: cytochrome b/b6 domain-containing protein [Acetobacteraceae bacterium]